MAQLRLHFMTATFETQIRLIRRFIRFIKIKLNSSENFVEISLDLIV